MANNKPDPPSTIEEALAFWQTHPTRNPNGVPVTEAKTVKLFAMKPPIVEMDTDLLGTLSECEHLALSTNNIEKIAPIPGMVRLKVLSLARNNISRIQNLEGVAVSLEQLWLSYNSISSLTGVDRLKQLRVLCIGNNQIKKWEEVSKLEKNTLLSELVLKGNPIYINAKNGEIGYVKAVLNMFPRLQKLDGIVVATWRKRIDEYHTSKLKGLFDRIDLDRSGTITAAEMNKVLKGDDEMRKVLGIQAGQEQTVFSEMDEDGGGDISWDEFLLYFGTRLNDF